MLLPQKTQQLLNPNQLSMVGDKEVEAPVIIKRTPLRFPEDLMVREKPYLIFGLEIKKDGSVGGINVRPSTKNQETLTRFLLDNIRKWEFLPGKVNQRPADILMVIRVDITLH